MNYPDPIVFIPGLLCDGALWQSQLQYFAPKCGAAVFTPSEDDSIPAMAQRILGNAPPRFVLCGLSMGGYVAMEIMRIAPDRVSRLILADTSARVDTPEQRQRRLDMINLAEKSRFRGVTRQLLPQWLAPNSLEKEEIGAIVIEMSVRLGKDVYIKQQRAVMNRIDSRPSLSLIKCPTCVIVGRLDQVTPLEIAQETAALITSSTIQVIEESAHLTPIEQPERFNAVLENFIKFV